ncbi:hypothetical protein OHT20_06535 [Streptomyces caniferus]|uniref:Resolvase/invertase-type recombinase catalytic domain-containing protein n=1 Tax=Streptomyces caniferus TaxID=285557 RepID=A0A640S8Q8_9ACTN|nr:hypothetical protein [Streptomyces caniferus]GFE06821.1 hypothetical protein Scani_30890 [Streptomyces caniferus]
MTASLYAQAPLAFVYDRCASSRTRRDLDMRLLACQAYVDRMRWVLAGRRWLDLGAHALGTHRPAVAALTEAMRAEAGRRPVLCLVHTWGRLATDDTHRLQLQQRIIEAGGWTVTTFGESDEHAARAITAVRQA